RLRRSAYSRADFGSWIEHGPTIASNGPRPVITRARTCSRKLSIRLRAEALKGWVAASAAGGGNNREDEALVMGRWGGWTGHKAKNPGFGGTRGYSRNSSSAFSALRGYPWFPPVGKPVVGKGAEGPS